ncbi:MAG: SCP2 sterol-binding domain-containing protein [Rubellimicrobium sp.]|nr:SCP2 sterol-binding domain-containing protein [Rubellimicrobium sp.]
MSEIVDKAVAILNAKLGGQGFDGSAKFVFEGEGTLILDADGARAGDEETDVTLTATAEVFQAILSGDQNPTSAFMSGRLAIDGSMGQAMKLAAIL